jgi:hypothetical protein
MIEIAGEAKPLAGRALQRSQAALGQLRAPLDFDIEKAETRLAEMVGTFA